MMNRKSRLAILPTGLAASAAFAAAPLPSWHDNAARQDILEFVDKVTRRGSPHFVAPGERIAVFDNDGTLWSEQPVYFQLQFAADRVRALAPQHPEWRDRQPFKGLLEGNLEEAAAAGERGIVELMMATHAGMTTDEFEKIVNAWIATARHPRFHRAYTDLVYQPMLELIAYLRTNAFKTYIVSGGGIEFMRCWAASAYGIPPEQVIGSSIELKYELRNGQPVLARLPRADFVDDKAGKPVGIQKFIGRRPLMAFGNSDGDLQMLQWTTAGTGPRFAGLIHHTDARREWAYDRKSHIGRLDKALDAATLNGWTVIDMKTDWSRVYSWISNR